MNAHGYLLAAVVIVSVVLSTAPCAVAGDRDGDGVDDLVDVCCETPVCEAFVACHADREGRPLGDLDLDCDVDLDDFSLFQVNFTGRLLCDGRCSCVSAEDCDLPMICNTEVGYCELTPCGVSCKDTLFCNGEEVYVDWQCQLGASPCPAECDEETDACVPSSAELHSIHSSQTVRGGIDSSADTDSYGFIAEAGGTVIIQASRESGGLEPCIDLYAPSSGANPETTVCGWTSVLLRWGAQEAGEHRIVVRDDDGDSPGDYSLSLLIVPGAVSGPICPEETTEGAVFPRADTDAGIFMAEAGSTVVIQASRESGGMDPCIDLYAPSSGADPMVTACDWHSVLLQSELDEAGQYTIVVRDEGGNHTGDYSLSLIIIP